MRKPFVLTCGNRNPLTELQRRRRARLVTSSRAYKRYLKQLGLNRSRRPERRRLPKAKSLFLRYASLQNPRISLLTEAIESIDGGLGKPTEELMLELDIWTKLHRNVLRATRF